MNVKSDKWPAFDVERRSVAALKPYKNNARTHSEEQVAQIAASIREWGWTQPVLVDEKGGVLAGHGRLMAAQSLGIEEVPVIVARGWSKDQKRAYVLADNQLALNAGWDQDLLRVEIGALGDAFDRNLLGFGDEFLAELFADKTGGLTDPDEVPAVGVNAVSRPCDLWVCGSHRLLCGDSTNPDALATLMTGKRADLLFTSPPYAQQRDYGSAAKAMVGQWDSLMNGVFAAAPVKDDAQLLVNLGLVHRDGEWTPYWDRWIEWMRGQGWRRFGWYVWDQGPGLPGDWNGRPAPSHEFIFHFNREARRANKTKAKLPASIQYNDHGNGMRRKDGKMSGVSSPEKSLQTHKVPDSVFRVMRHKARGPEVAHPAVFPVALVEEIFGAYSKPGDLVFEPFSGSGTQIIAAEKMGRMCFGADIDPAYCDVAVRRWQALTGREATLEGDGRTFEEISDERYDPAKDSAASYDAAIEAKRQRLEAAE